MFHLFHHHGEYFDFSPNNLSKSTMMKFNDFPLAPQTRQTSRDLVWTHKSNFFGESFTVTLKEAGRWWFKIVSIFTPIPREMI